MIIMSKIEAPVARYLYEGKHVEINIIFFSEITFLHQNYFLAQLLCHVTYITSLNKCSDPGVKLASLDTCSLMPSFCSSNFHFTFSLNLI